ncbi:hypothetical protein ZOSMA_349G00150 [Zostera marina]|uniref:Uncharacterized protein n=1 Tax=Zostera marina TaxID=29655 RepID=A0A0K9P760_ZOSMR|nr:hypothetical protein ZOSMA_349G00150 [Zostera marina]
MHHNKEDCDGEVNRFFNSTVISIAAILLDSYRRLEKSTGLVRAVIRRISPIVTYITSLFIARLMRRVGLSVVSFGEDYVLPFVCSVVVFAASSAVVVFLTKMGCGLEDVVKKLPEKFETAVDGFPLVVRRVPVFGWMIALILLVLFGGECWFAPNVVEEEKRGAKEEKKIEMKAQKIWKEEEVVMEKNIPTNVRTEEAGKDEIAILDFFEEGWHSRPLIMMTIRK